VAIRYEFSFAVGAIVAVLHDILLTIAVYCLTVGSVKGGSFNATDGCRRADHHVFAQRQSRHLRSDSGGLKLGVRGSLGNSSIRRLIKR